MVLEQITILREVDISEASIKLRSDGIVMVNYKKNTTLDVALQMRMRNIYNELTGHKKLKFLFTADEGFILTKEARENGPRIQKDSPIYAYAFVANQLPYRLIVNFYFKVFKPFGKYKIVANSEEGIAWLHSLGDPEY